VRERGISGQDDCRPGAAGPRLIHVYGGAHAKVRAPTHLHGLKDARTGARHQDRIPAAARTDLRQAVRVTERD